MINNRQCVRCVNDRTVKNITFDANGLCSHCSCYDKYRPRLKDYDALEKYFQNRIRTDGKYDYDAAIGFSGGKDSTYVLYKAVKEYGLKVRAFTLDNGFLSGEAKDKISRIADELGVGHEFVVCDTALLKKTYGYITSRYLSPCIACSFLGYAAMINYPSKINAGVCIHGRSPYQMLRGLSDSSDDVFRPFIDAGLSDAPVDPERLYGGVIGKITSNIDPDLARDIKEVLLRDAAEKGYRDFIAYFLYHPYDPKEIVSFLEKNTSWRVESEEEHFDCTIHHGALYLKDLVARRPHLMPEYSVMINEGAITKEEALSRMATGTDRDTALGELDLLCRYAGISRARLMLKAKIYSKRWW